MSTEKNSEGLYRTNSSMTGRNSKDGPEKLDTKSVVQAVEQDDPSQASYDSDRTQRTLKVCKCEAFLVISFGLIQFLEIQNRHIQLIGIGGKSRSRPTMTTELLKPCIFNFRYHWNGTICTNRFKSDQRRTWYGNSIHASPTGDIHTHAISFSASLFIAFTIWCTFILAVNSCLSKFSCSHWRLLNHKA
jgi:hypothetical protein